MKVKTSDLIGAQLDWAVAKCEGVYFAEETNNSFLFKWKINLIPHYSAIWDLGGPIIEREQINIEITDTWRATLVLPLRSHRAWGATPLIAAMRCYVASKLGDEVDIPEELV